MCEITKSYNGPLVPLFCALHHRLMRLFRSMRVAKRLLQNLRMTI
jgi:hypothetical protein